MTEQSIVIDDTEDSAAIVEAMFQLDRSGQTLLIVEGQRCIFAASRDSDGSVFKISRRAPLGQIFYEDHLSIPVDIESKHWTLSAQRIQTVRGRVVIYEVPMDSQKCLGTIRHFIRCAKQQLGE